MQIVDMRSADYNKAAHVVRAHDEPVNGIAFNPASDFVIATASSDKTIGLWDLRNLKSKLHSLAGHTQDVVGVQWSPHEEPILASSSGDRRVIFWDLSRIGEEQTAEDAEDGPPEMYVSLFNIRQRYMLTSVVSLCTAGTPTASLTFAGIPTTRGSFALRQRITLSKCGRRPALLLVRILRMLILLNWRHSRSCFET